MPAEPHAPLALIDGQSLVGAGNDSWYDQALCRVNDCVVRPGIGLPPSGSHV